VLARHRGAPACRVVTNHTECREAGWGGLAAVDFLHMCGTAVPGWAEQGFAADRFQRRLKPGVRPSGVVSICSR